MEPSGKARGNIIMITQYRRGSTASRPAKSTILLAGSLQTETGPRRKTCKPLCNPAALSKVKGLRHGHPLPCVPNAPVEQPDKRSQAAGRVFDTARQGIQCGWALGLHTVHGFGSRLRTNHAGARNLVGPSSPRLPVRTSRSSANTPETRPRRRGAKLLFLHHRMDTALHHGPRRGEVRLSSQSR